MTTIAYNVDKHEIAVDSRATCENLIISDREEKWFITDDYLFFFAGSAHIIDLIHAHYPDIDFDGNSNCQGFIYHRHSGELHSVVWVEGERIDNIIHDNFALGSGMHHALTAMDLGASAKQAVKAAMKRDNATGGKVHVFKLNDYFNE